jgi:putative DNA primase/helicase
MPRVPQEHTARILSLLEGVKPSGNGWTARCPAHDDRSPSLSISDGDGFRTLLHCHTGCTQEAVVAALGVTLADLFPTKAEAALRHGDKRPPVATYIYRDATGAIKGRVCRTEPKRFYQERWDGGRFVSGLNGQTLPLYHLLEVLASDLDAWVLITEGEKDCDRLAAVGFVATTNAGGAGKWRGEYSEALLGRRVCILPDNDVRGEDHATQVARSLQGIACEVRVLHLPGLPGKGDVSDWLDAGGTAQELARLIGEAPAWQPCTLDTKAEQGSSFARITSVARDKPVPTYPVHVWPRPLSDYMTAAAASVDAPVDMIAVPMQAILGAVIGNRRPLEVKPGWVVRPVIWAAIIAGVSTAKSPMLDHALRLVAGLQADAVQVFEDKKRDYEAELARVKAIKGEAPPIRPILQNYLTTNATMEWYAPAARDSAGIVMVRDELLGWLLDFDAYRSGKGGDRQNWLSNWSGGALKVDRKGIETVYAEHPVICVTGGIQPGRFPELARDAAEDGFLARFLLSVPPADIPKWSEETVPEAVSVAARNLVARLRHTAPLPPLPLSVGAHAAFREWHDENRQAVAAAPPLLAPTFGKLPVQLARMALILHSCNDPEAEEPSLLRQHMLDAIEVIEYHRAHAIRAYELLGVVANSHPVGLARRILGALERSLGEGVNRRDLHNLLGGHVPADDLSMALDDLRARGLIACERVSTGGRPAEVYRSITVTGREHTKEYEQSLDLGSVPEEAIQDGVPLENPVVVEARWLATLPADTLAVYREVHRGSEVWALFDAGVAAGIKVASTPLP